MNRIGTIGIVTLIAGLLPLAAEAGTLDPEGFSAQSAPSIQSTTTETSDRLSVANITTRPCSDFLNAQGTLNDPPQFFPDVKDYVGWGDPVNPTAGLPNTFGLVDYAKLADQYLGKKLGTKVTCLVTQGKLSDGSAKITVALIASKALGFAQSVADLAANNFDFLDTRTIFGAKAQDVAKGAEPALGPATLDVSFRISAPKAAPAGQLALPDLLDVVNAPCKYVPVNLLFGSSTFGKRRDGRKALLSIVQVGSLDKRACKDDPNDPDNPTSLIYTKEVVKIIP